MKIINSTQPTNNYDNNSVYKDGYSFPIYGLDSGHFTPLHITALICISISFMTVCSVIYSSFKSQQNVCSFFQWSKSERFVVYMGLCDGLFNMFHFIDHLHILIIRDHVFPKALCMFYSFAIGEFMAAQKLMVNVVAINAFILVYFNKNIEFGKYDWIILAWIFGCPAVALLIAMAYDTLGPNGTFCYFDTVHGEGALLLINTMPLITILLTNSILYILTWYKLRTQETTFRNLSGNEAQVLRASHYAARNMILFVVAFFIQWLPIGIYGVWKLVTSTIPTVLFHLITSFSNIGGLLNGIVYVIIRRRKVAVMPREKPVPAHEEYT